MTYRAPIRTVLCLGLALFACSPAHASAGRYLDYGSQPLGSYEIGPDGVPLRYVDGRRVRHPVGVAQWGLRNWSHGRRRPLVAAANWFVRHQRADGAFVYSFDFDALGVHMHAPWISAMAQGQAISVLVRAARWTDRPRYLRVARRALAPASCGGAGSAASPRTSRSSTSHGCAPSSTAPSAMAVSRAGRAIAISTRS